MQSKTVGCRTKWLVFDLILSSALMLFVQLPARADQSVTLTWNASTATNMAGYKIYYGTASHNYSNVVAVGNVTNATVAGLVAGQTYYFAATTFDGAGDESVFSNEASYAVPLMTPTITTLPVAGAITCGQTLASSSLSGGAASTAGSFAFATPGLTPNAGTANVPVTFTPADASNFTTATATVSVTVNPALATVTLGNLSQTYDGTAKPVNVTTSPAGLNVGVTYNASSLPPTNAGSYLVVATVNDPNYAGSATNTLVIGQAAASVTLNNLSQSYDGKAKFVTASTVPSNLKVVLTYNGSPSAPINPGNYQVVGTIVDINYQGNATKTLKITLAKTRITLPTALPTSDGQFSFTVSDNAGLEYVVQASTNLVDWDSVQTNIAPFVFTDTNAGSFSQRFYRTYYLSP
jgi:hypothetical protein